MNISREHWILGLVGVAVGVFLGIVFGDHSNASKILAAIAAGAIAATIIQVADQVNTWRIHRRSA